MKAGVMVQNSKESPVGHFLQADPGPNPKAYAELIYDLFGESKESVVCAFTSAASREGTSEVCKGVAYGLAGNVEARERQIALLDGRSLLSGRAISDLMPVKSAPYADPLGVWSWPPSADPEAEVQVNSSLAIVETLAALRARFGYVILDCPAASGIGMAASLAAAADKVVLVVREGGARRKQIVNALKMLTLRGAPLVGCVLLDKNLDLSRPLGVSG